MTDITKLPTAVVITYTDPLENFQGFLAIDSLNHRVAAGGMRVQKGLTARTLAKMARNMTLKQRICGMAVDGAKCGIDYDPASPGKHRAMARFFTAIAPYLKERYSMGPDMNTKLPEIDSILREIGIPSAKMAVARAQGLSLEEFLGRYETFSQKVDGYTLGQRRSGHGVAMSCLAALDRLNISPREARVAVQGFGGLGSGAAYSLYLAGVKIVAVSDKDKCIICRDDKGLNIPELLDRSKGTLLPRLESSCWAFDCSDAVLDTPCDVLVPAAVENVIDHERAASLPVNALVEGANLPASPEAERVLHERGVLVVPDFIAGSAGSLSVDGLFGPSRSVDAPYVLRHIERRIRAIVREVFQRSERFGCTPREAALAICSEVEPAPLAKPYGHHLSD